MKKITAAIAFGLTFITGLLLVFIGVRFFISPNLAELGFPDRTQHSRSSY